MIAFLPLVPLAIPFVLGTLLSLRDTLFPPAAPTAPVAPPYTPPFTKGQCVGVTYNIGVKIYNSQGTKIADSPNYGSLIGAITATSLNIQNLQGELFNGLRGSNGSTLYGWRTTSPDPTRVQTGEWILTPPVGYTDNCGNLPDPNPAPPTSSDGLAESSPPSLDINALPVVEGSPLVALPSFGSALAAALAAARAAANALDAIKSIADAIDTIKDLLDYLNNDAKERDKEKKKDYFSYKLGSIRKDGFLRFYPFDNSAEWKAEQLDITMQSIPTWYGKYFGQNSPNFYRFKSLGYIAFVSPTFGILEYREIEFSRMSLTVPVGAIGFFYHLGLENELVANAIAFYSKPQTEQ